MQALRIFILYTTIISCCSCGGAIKLGLRFFSRTASTAAKVGKTQADDVLRYSTRVKVYPRVSGSTLGSSSYDDVLNASLRARATTKTSGSLLSSTSKEISGSATAKEVVSPASIEIKILGSNGLAVSSFTNAQEILLRNRLQNVYRQKFVDVVDDVFSSLNGKQITTAEELDREIIKLIKERIKGQPNFAFDMNTGSLSYQFEDFSGSINIIKSVRNGLALAGGYYLLDKMSGE